MRYSWLLNAEEDRVERGPLSADSNRPSLLPHDSLFTTHYPISPALCFHTLMSCPSGLIDLQFLCFHGLTNCFSRNLFVLIVICVAGGCAQIPPSLRRFSALCVSALFFLQVVAQKAGGSNPNLYNFGAPINTFRMNTCKSVSKQTTSTPFRMNTSAKRGRGVSFLL